MSIDKKPKFRSVVMPGANNIEERSSKAKSSALAQLVLDNDSSKPTRTLTELYNELEAKENEGIEEDYYEISSYAKRAVAFGVDVVFILGLIKLALFLAPLEMQLSKYLLGKYQLVFIFKDATVLMSMHIFTLFLEFFFLLVIPVAFFNTSVGKKITGQRVRGENKYTLSISQAFKRELIWKPLGIVCLAGFVMPFLDKKRQRSFHDKFAGTFVVND